jgi:hypothetical protein
MKDLGRACRKNFSLKSSCLAVGRSVGSLQRHRFTNRWKAFEYSCGDPSRRRSSVGDGSWTVFISTRAAEIVACGAFPNAISKAVIPKDHCIHQ